MKRSATGFNILITAGPTREFIDPVRFISNPATGMIGYRIAAYARAKGHRVVLISGPTHLVPPSGVTTIGITSARDVQQQARRYRSWADCVIATAAVSDFRPARFYPEKVKKNRAARYLRLVKNPDVLKNIGLSKRKHSVIIGFALETENLVLNARKKLKDKNLDFIVANRLSATEMPFGPGKQTVYLISRQAEECFENIGKEKLARIILDRAVKLCYSLQKKEVSYEQAKKRVYAR